MFCSRKIAALGALLLLRFSATAFVASAPERAREGVRRRLFEHGAVQQFEGLAAALAGGTVGVLGSVLAIERKLQTVQESKDCPYCDGHGVLLCAGCLGTGLAPDGSPCPVCGGLKYISCENCKGRGRFMPTMLDSRASRDPESDAENIGLL